jgi:ribosomal protein S18 acetylase RimI-like enzyme
VTNPVAAEPPLGFPSIRVRDATADDLPMMARVHRLSYSRDHFLALLPEKALINYYSRFIGNGSQIVVAVGGSSSDGRTRTDEFLGFAVFGRDIEPRIADFKKDCRWSIAATAFCHPVLAARKAVIALEGRLFASTPHEPAATLLLSIVVRQIGAGVGRVLLESMLSRCIAAGEERVGLYVRHSNVAAINAYLRVGFRIVASITDQYYMERTLVPGLIERKT